MEIRELFRPKLLATLAIGAALWPGAAYANTYQDLRSPDARDAARAAEPAPTQDLRSPDTRDAAGQGHVARAEAPVEVPATITAPAASPGFEWDDAAIGAAVTLALVTLAGTAALLTARGRQRTPTT